MKRYDFNFSINGHSVSPRSVDLRDLLEVLSELESAIAATARRMAPEPIGERTLSLIAVGDGSNQCTLATSDVMFHATETLVSCIARDEYSPLPDEAVASLHRLWKRSVAKNWTFKLFGTNGFGAAEITPSHELKLRARTVSGRTTLYGKLDRIGGETNPTAWLIVPKLGRTTVQVKTTALAKVLADSLFKMVGLEGEAQWDHENWKLAQFRADRLVGVYESGNVVGVFSRLAAAAGDTWNDVDPDEFVRNTRSDD